MAQPVRSRLSSSFVFFGARFPAAVVWLAGTVLVGSCLGAVDYRVGYKLMRFVTLEPTLVMKGEIWRLFTWSFFETQPLGLIFGCLILLVFGRDLADVWGARRLWITYLLLSFLSGGITTLLSLAWSDLRAWDGVTVWALADALIIAWASLIPSRTMLVSFVIPLSGRNLVYGTFGATLVFALLMGFAAFVPHFIAMGLMLLYLREPAIGRLWQRLTLGMRGGQRKRPTHLRAVDRLDRDEEPPRWLH
jgi:membrane associated rhomboid family serine protease